VQLLLLLIFSLAGLAQELTLGHTNSYNLILKSNSCEKIIEDHQSICSWKELLNKEFKAPRIDESFCEDRGLDKRRTIVSSCLPEFTKKNHKRKIYKDGANCWGTAMSFKRISKKPRFIWSKEMIYWMNSPLCRKLESSEEKRPGDIINVYGPEYFFGDDSKTKGDHFWDALYPNRYLKSPVATGYTGYHNFLHSETYLSDRLTFGKDSPNKLDRFNFNKLNEVYGRSRNIKCQENGDLSPHFREYLNDPKDLEVGGCKYFTTIHRCEDFKNYFSRLELSEGQKQVLREIDQLQGIQETLFPLLMDQEFELSNIEIDKMIKIADHSSSLSLEQLATKSLSEKSEMLNTLRFFTAQGIRKTLELADLIEATEAL
jgi:hypothetical protein